MTALFQSFANVVRVIPHSGIQYLDYAFNADEARFSVHWAAASNPVETAESLCLVEPDPDNSDGFIDSDGQPVTGEVCSISSAKAIERFLDSWLPLPFLRVRDRPHGDLPQFAHGPTNWARCKIMKLDRADALGHTHHVVLALDSALVRRREGKPYSAPVEDDVRAGAEFELAVDYASCGWFTNETWVEEWIKGVVAGNGKPSRSRRGPEPDPNEPKARYLALLRVLGAAIGNHAIAFVDTVSTPRRYAPIDVDLVLDVGNSRTCGILIESIAGEKVDLNNAYPLELRDLSHPCRTHVEPFPSSIEFARTSFGNERLSRRSGRADAFSWPSAVRVGFEAARLSNMLAGTEGTSGLSTPKRYLWDTAPRSHEWRFNRHGENGDGEVSIPSVSCVQYFREDGEVKTPNDPPLINALFSRSSLMTFFLCEIFIQAFVSMNSVPKRYQRAHSEVPRRLNRIILTMPTAMPLAERQRFRKRAQAALDLVWKDFGAADETQPQVLMQWDEASGTQAVFLYSEVHNNFNGQAPAFFRCGGRVRAGHGDEPSLRVASIDIGGGTTDLIITTYELEGGVAIKPVQEFREGLNFAGDDILCGIIERHVLPNILEAMRAASVVNPVRVVADRFGDNRAGITELEKSHRKLFASQVANPLALRIVHLYENYDPLQGGQVYGLKIADVLSPDAQISPDVLAYVESAAHDAGGADFRLMDVVFHVDIAAVDNTVRRLIGQILGDFCEVINLYDCDYLLLSGRPSRMPAVRSSILSKMPVMADRVYSMHRYRVGSWYPFRDALGRLSDPKTTASVGAMVCALSEGRLDDFHLSSRQMKMVSTARYIGEMEQTGQIRASKVFFENIDLENRKRRLPAHTFDFYAPIFIGFRQLAAERWPSTMLYRVDFKIPDDAQRYQLPLRITIEQAPADDDLVVDDEDFQITEVTDANGEQITRMPVTQRLQTLRTDAGYWIDTGVFDTPTAVFGDIAK
jgi:hypothetical protein